MVRGTQQCLDGAFFGLRQLYYDIYYDIWLFYYDIYCVIMSV